MAAATVFIDFSAFENEYLQPYAYLVGGIYLYNVIIYFNAR